MATGRREHLNCPPLHPGELYETDPSSCHTYGRAKPAGRVFDFLADTPDSEPALCLFLHVDLCQRVRSPGPVEGIRYGFYIWGVKGLHESLTGVCHPAHHRGAAT